MKTKVYKRTNASLFDIPIESICDALADGLPWLKEVFGKTERICVKNPEGINQFYPAWYKEGNDYIYTLPDDRVGNMAFFALDDMEITTNGLYSVPFSLIVWGDMDECTKERNLENIKAQVLKVLNSARIENGSMKIRGIYETSERVWNGYTIDETTSQFMLHPFFGIRIYGTLTTREVCR